MYPPNPCLCCRDAFCEGKALTYLPCTFLLPFPLQRHQHHDHSSKFSVSLCSSVHFKWPCFWFEYHSWKSKKHSLPGGRPLFRWEKGCRVKPSKRSSTILEFLFILWVLNFVQTHIGGTRPCMHENRKLISSESCMCLKCWRWRWSWWWWHLNCRFIFYCRCATGFGQQF